MKKINDLVISALTAAFLVGCGGGGGSSSTSSTTTETTTPTVTTTDVTVERGAVYGATVTDANGQVATQKPNSNVYTFATTPVYPITASGGIIDVDNNGIDEGDIELTTVLTSYSNVVTPITSYLGNPATDSGKAKLAKLKEIAGVTSDDDFFKKAPSELLDDVGTNVLVLTNALFDIMNDGDSTNDDFVSSYVGSSFETKITTLKEEAKKYTDKKEMAKALEEKVVTNLGLTKLKTEDLANTTTSTTLKVADLKRYVNYEEDDIEWYGETIIADGKLTFKDYDYEYNSETTEYEWKLDANSDEYITYTPDATNPYRFSYVDPISKEEGTFTILSTKKVANYSDLYKTEAKIVVTKKATELKWNGWNWETPSYWDDVAQKDVLVTDIASLVKMFTVGNNWLGLDSNTHVFFASDGTMVNSVKNQSGSLEKSTLVVGSWKQEGDYVVATIGTEIRYFKVGSENGVYYVTEAEMREVGNVMSETMYTGTSLDEFILNIKTNVDEQTATPTDYTTFSKSDLVGKKLVAANETFFFQQDSVVLGDSGADYTETLSYTTVASNKIVLSNGDILEKTADGYKLTFESATAQEEVFTGLQLTTFTQEELNTALSDTPPTPATPTDATTFSKSDLVGKKLVVGNETHFFQQDSVVLGDSGDNYTNILTYSSVTSNKIVLSNGDVFEKTADGFKLTTYDGTLIEDVTTGLQLTTFTQEELNTALTDVEPSITTTSFVSGKLITFGGNNTMTATFNSNGTYSENEIGDHTCSGLWKDLGNNKIGVTCQDNGTTEVPDGIIDANSNEITFQFPSNTLTVGQTITYEDADGTGNAPIIAISNIAN